VGKAICVFGQKGGAGKTTTVVNLAAALSLSAKRTLLIDVDPQGSATAMVSVLSRRYRYSLQDVIMQGVPVERAIVQGCLHHLKVLPAPPNTSLNDHLRVCRSAPGALQNALAPIRDAFDYILMDAPTSDWSYITHAAAACDYLLFILRADYQTFRFLSKSLEILKTIKTRFNPKLKLAGIVLTLYDPRDEECVWILRKALQHLPKWLFRTLIPRDSAIAASALAEKPIVVSDYDGAGARSFRFLANEFVERIG
jgi:chromosome partitioning protein